MDPIILLVMIFSGILAGFLAGLMGIGGGIVTVPILYYVLGFYGVQDAIIMHMTVGTSLAIIVPTSLVSSWSHHKKDAVDLALVKGWAVFIGIGAIYGVWLATFLDGESLKIFFAVMALLLGFKLLLGREKGGAKVGFPNGIIGKGVAALIGGLSSLMGIGGATFSVPVLTFYGFSIHKAVGTASLLGLLISLPAVIGYAYNGMAQENLPPFSFGYISLAAFLIMAPFSGLMAPIGVRVAHMLPKRRVSVFFGAFLIITSLRMTGVLS